MQLKANTITEVEIQIFFLVLEEKKKVIFKSTVINFLTLVPTAWSQDTSRASTLDFQQIPQKNRGRNEKINPQYVVRGLNWFSFSPWMEGDGGRMAQPMGECHIPKKPQEGKPGSNGGVTSANPGKGKDIFPVLCLGDPANGVINLGSHLQLLHSLPPPPFPAFRERRNPSSKEPGI